MARKCCWQVGKPLAVFSAEEFEPRRTGTMYVLNKLAQSHRFINYWYIP
jgi:hypothetical protein